jgi:cell division protein FtsZ
LSGRIRVSVVATGIDTPVAQTADNSMPRGGPRLVAVAGGAPVPMPMPIAASAAIAQPMPIGAPIAQTGTVLQFDAVPQQISQPEVTGATMAMEPNEAPRPNAAPRNTLFTDPPAAPAATTAVGGAKTSMFNLFTGSRRKVSAEAEAAPRAEPHMAPEREPTALVRQAGADAEATGLDIPAFLRRQTN